MSDSFASSVFRETNNFINCCFLHPGVIPFEERLICGFEPLKSIVALLWYSGICVFRLVKEIGSTSADVRRRIFVFLRFCLTCYAKSGIF